MLIISILTRIFVTIMSQNRHVFSDFGVTLADSLLLEVTTLIESNEYTLCDINVTLTVTLFYRFFI